MSATTYLRSAGEVEPQRSDRRRTVLLVAAATVAVAVLVTWLVAFSPVFGVRTIEVRGAHALNAAQVRSAAGIKNGTPLVRVDTAAATQRIEKLADVASAQVSTSFPSKVVITVDEREPVGYVHQAAGHEVLVDRTGDQYREVHTVPKGLPKFVVPVGTSARTTGGAVATVAAALPATLLRHVKSIEALDTNAITLVLTRDRVVQWGSAGRSAEKAHLLPTLLRHGVTQVDLTNPDQPFTR
jgi:cell division protein FtsQ